MPEEVTFGRRVYAAMTARKMSVGELARLTGLGIDEISRLVADQAAPTEHQRVKIESALGLSSD